MQGCFGHSLFTHLGGSIVIPHSLVELVHFQPFLSALQGEIHTSAMEPASTVMIALLGDLIVEPDSSVLGWILRSEA